MNRQIFIFGLIIIIISLLNELFPEFTLKFGNAWKFEGDLKPKSDAIFIWRFISALTMTLGLIMVVYGTFFDSLNEYFGWSSNGYGWFELFRLR